MARQGQYDDAEGRLNLQEVPEKISRIFFGDPSQGGYDSYGAPAPSYNAPNTGGYGYQYNGGSYYYPNFPADLELLMKLGHGALILFIILAVVGIIFLLILTCIYCSSGLYSRQRRDGADGDYPMDGYPDSYRTPGGEEIPRSI